VKAVILSDIEEFCRDHNVKSISLEMLRSMAVDNTEKGQNLSYQAGFACCNQAVIRAMSEAKARFAK